MPGPGDSHGSCRILGCTVAGKHRCAHGWATKTSFQSGESRGPAWIQGSSAADLARAVLPSTSRLLPSQSGFVLPSTLVEPGPRLGPEGPASRARELQSRRQGARRRLVPTNSPNPGRQADDRGLLLTLKSSADEKKSPGGCVGGGGEQSLSNLFAHNCLFLSRKSLKQTCRERRPRPESGRAASPLLATLSPEQPRVPFDRLGVVGRTRTPAAHRVPGTLQEATLFTPLFLVRIPQPGVPDFCPQHRPAWGNLGLSLTGAVASR